MKTVNEIKQQTPIFLNDFNNSLGVFQNFELKDSNGINILFASYGCANYEGYAFVLFEKDNSLYEVNGSHCSCYGLEGQWEPEKTDLSAIEHRLTHGSLGVDGYSGNEFAKELKEFIGINELNK
jgi:hypothetical protein